MAMEDFFGEGWSGDDVPPPPASEHKRTKRQNKDAAQSRQQKKCFTCDEMCKKKSKWCPEDTKTVELLRYQARAAPDVDDVPAIAILERVLEEEAKCKEAIAEFNRDNPPGKWRKKKVDWGAFQRRFGQRTSRLYRETETPMDIGEFVTYQEGKRKDPKWAAAEFQRLRDETEIARMGTGADLKLWIPTSITREKVREAFVEGSYNEGYKNIKTPTEDDANTWKDFAKTSAPTFNNDFLRNGACNDEQMDEENAKKRPKDKDVPPEAPAKKRRVDLVDAAPKARDKMSKQLPVLEAAVEAAKVAARAAVKLAEDNPYDEDISQASYKSTVEVRLKLLEIWGKRTLDSQAVDDQIFDVGSSKLGGKQGEGTGNGSADTPQKTPKAAEGGASALSPDSAQKAPGTPSLSGSSAKFPKEDSIGERVTAVLLKELEEGGMRSAIVTDRKGLKSYTFLEELLTTVLNAPNVASLDQMVTTFMTAQTTVKEIVDGTKTSAASLKSFVEGRLRKTARKIEDERKAAEKAAMKASRQKAKSLEKELADSSSSLPNIFTINFEEASVLAVPKVKGDEMKDVFIDKPFVITSPWQELEDLTKAGKVQMALAQYGGSYKVSPAYKSDARAQQPLDQKDGKDEFDQVISAVNGKIQADHKIPDDVMPQVCKNVITSSWLYGYSDKMHTSTLNPFGLPMYKLLLSGNVRYILFEPVSLLEAIRKDMPDFVAGYANVSQFLLKADRETVAKLKSNGCLMFTVVQKEKECLFVPAGFIYMERSVQGVLVYGMRKTWVYKTNVHLQSYGALIDLFRKDGKNVDKMVDAQQAMG